MQLIETINSHVNSFAWGWPTMILLIGTGVYLTVRLGFVQFRHFGYIMKNTLGKVFTRRSAGSGSVAPFQAVSTALAATIGTGNIVGVSGAIITGGPGAVFWLWVSGLVGMATKYTEVLLALKYRERNSKGEWVGGPMYYIQNGLGRNWRWLGCIFCILGALAAFGIGCLSQISSMVNAMTTAIEIFVPSAGSAHDVIALCIGVATAAILAVVLIGGIKRIGRAAETIVPVMSCIYILCALVVILVNIGSIGPVLKSIFVGAFAPESFVGGAVGITLKAAMKGGIGRGLFSNEAGQGSAPIAHAAADTDDPVKQGMYGVFEVFFDTIVICSITCLAVLMSGVGIEYGTGSKDILPISAFASVFGDKFGSLFVALALMLFAFSTMLTWSLYGVRCFEYLTGSERFSRVYQVIFLAVVVYGATIPLGLAYDISETLNGLMVIPNLVAVLGLSGVAVKLTRDHFSSNGLRKR